MSSTYGLHRLKAEGRGKSAAKQRIPSSSGLRLAPDGSALRRKEKLPADGPTQRAFSRRDSFEMNKRRTGGRAAAGSSSRELDELSRHLDDEDFDDGLQHEQKAELSRHNKAPRPRGILSTAKGPSDRRRNGGLRRVSFNKNAMLHYMPAHELVAARRARKGSWESAPEHDTLWDGDLQDFRRVPLTEAQLDKLLRRRDRFDHGFTFPQPTYSSSGGSARQDLDELDAYMDDLSLGSTLDHMSYGDRFSQQRKQGCYVCRPTVEWTTLEVSAFIRDHISGGDFFCLNFEQSHVDGPMLLQMEERDLRNIGVKRRADRQAILMAKQELLRGSLSQHSCSCTKGSSTQQVLDRHSNFLEATRSFLDSL